MSSAREGDSEFDRYLVTAAVRLWNGDSPDDVADYLVEVAVERIGMDAADATRERALLAAEAFDAYLNRFRAPPVTPARPEPCEVRPSLT